MTMRVWYHQRMKKLILTVELIVTKKTIPTRKERKRANIAQRKTKATEVDIQKKKIT